MEFGDKVMVTYKNGDQFVGRIKDETEKMWVIEFDDGDTRRIRKTMQVELVDDPETPEDETSDRPSDSEKIPTIAWIIAGVLVAATAITLIVVL